MYPYQYSTASPLATPDALLALCHLMQLWQPITEEQCLFDLARASALPRSVEEYTHVARTGDHVSLDCDANREMLDPESELHYQSLVWWTSGKNEQTSINITIKRNGVDELFLGNGHYTMLPNASLVIHDLSHSDSGFYFCHALIGASQTPIHSSEKVLLVQEGAPLTPTHVTISGIQSRSFLVSWSVKEPTNGVYSMPLRFIIQYRKELEWMSASAVASGKNEVLVTQLYPYTRYGVRVIAENIMGQSEPSPETPLVTTACEAPTGQPTIVEVESQSNESLLVTWLMPPKHTRNCRVENYDIEYSVKGESESQSKTTLLHMSHNVPLDEQITSLTGLKPASIYLVKVAIINSKGTGPYSRPWEALTMEGVPMEPKDVVITSVNSRTMSVSWSKPEQVFGSLLGYKLRISTANHIYPTVIVGPRDQDFVFRNLRPITEYTVSVRGFTKAGDGAWSALVSRTTDVDTPSPPENVSVSISPHSIHALSITWQRPVHTYGHIERYEVSFREPDTNLHSRLTVVNSSTTQCEISSVYSGVKYEVWVTAIVKSIVTAGKIYESSSTHQFFTVPFEKGIPPRQMHVIVDPTAETFLSYAPFLAGSLGAFLAIVLAVIGFFLGRRRYRERVASRMALSRGFPCLSKDQGSFSNKWVNTASLQRSKKCTVSNSSGANQACSFPLGPSVFINQETNCLKMNLLTKATPATQFCNSFALSPNSYKLQDEFRSIQKQSSLSDFAGNSGHKADVVVVQNEPVLKKTSVRFKLPLSNSPRSLTLKTSSLLSPRSSSCPTDKHKEYNSLPLATKLNMQYNSSKLCALDSSFVDGFHRKNAYIATSAPKEKQIADMWHLVWNLQVRVMVMLTNLNENGRIKSEKYWPDFSQTFGTLRVVKVTEDRRAFFTIRRFKLCSLNHQSDSHPCTPVGSPQRSCENLLAMKANVSERHVTHYQFTDWLDHHPPKNTIAVLSLASRVQSDPSSLLGPILVHCSAGFGRTGTFIAIDAMLRMIKETNAVNLPAYLVHIRKQRPFLVQNEDQYIAIYDALQEYIQSGGSTFRSVAELCQISRVINNDSNPHSKSHNSEAISPLLAKCSNFLAKINKEFHSLDALSRSEISNKQTQLRVALLPENANKNRWSKFLPYESNRVILSCHDKCASSYINASFLQGFSSTKEFIMTQYPTASTLNDFWHMVYDQKCPIIVLLNDLADEEHKDTDEPVFWPTRDEENIELQLLTISTKIKDSDCCESKNGVDHEEERKFSVNDFVITPSEFQSGHNESQCSESCSLLRSELKGVTDSAGSSLQVRMYMEKDWPPSTPPPQRGESGTRESVSSTQSGDLSHSKNSTSPFDLINRIQLYLKALNAKSNCQRPVLVVDRCGGMSAATFCALWTLKTQLDRDSFVDAYHVVRLYQSARTGLFTNKADYFYLLKSISTYVKTTRILSPRREAFSPMRGQATQFLSWTRAPSPSRNAEPVARVSAEDETYSKQTQRATDNLLDLPRTRQDSYFHPNLTVELPPEEKPKLNLSYSLSPSQDNVLFSA